MFNCSLECCDPTVPTITVLSKKRSKLYDKTQGSLKRVEVEAEEGELKTNCPPGSHLGGDLRTVCY